MEGSKGGISLLLVEMPGPKFGPAVPPLSEPPFAPAVEKKKKRAPSFFLTSLRPLPSILGATAEGGGKHNFLLPGFSPLFCPLPHANQQRRGGGGGLYPTSLFVAPSTRPPPFNAPLIRASIGASVRLMAPYKCLSTPIADFSDPRPLPLRLFWSVLFFRGN